MRCHSPLIPALGRQRQANFLVRGQPGLQSEFQHSQGSQRNPVSIKPRERDRERERERERERKRKRKNMNVFECVRTRHDLRK